MVITADLALPEAGRALAARVDSLQLPVNLLINNAGFWSASAFVRQSADRDAQMIALNCAAVVDLAHAFLPEMPARGREAF
jgi:short-subunit dehydrogenase